MDVILIKNPDTLGWSGNPIPFVFSVQPYTDTERAADIRVMVRISIETNVGSNIFQEVRAQNFFPDNDGMIVMDLQSIVDAYLQYFVPRKSQNTILYANGQACRYMLTWQLNNQGILGTPQESGKYFAIKGTIGYENWPNAYRTLPVSDIIPLYSALEKKVLPTDLNWLYWMQPAGTAYKVRYTLTLEDGTTVTKDTPTYTFAYMPNICCVPTGISQMGLDVLAAGKDIVSYTVTVLKSTNVAASSPKTYVVDPRTYYKTKQLIWRDSTGGMESIPLTADISYEADYTRETGVRTLPPNYYQKLIPLPQTVVADVQETLKMTGYTGWLSEEETMQLRALFLTRELWEYDPQTGKIRPSILSATSAKFFTNSDDLISVEIAYNHAFTNRGYVPDDYGDATQSCPALDKLEIVQTSKYYLRITYAMPLPYEKIDLSITIGSVVYNYIVDGNFGVFNAYIDQVSADTAASIVGRVICDEFASPVSEGPTTTKSLTVVRWIPPVANDDYFSTTKNTPISSYGRIVIGGLISYRLTTTAVNIFDNDYSTDGDGFKIPSTWESSGPTNAGGTYSLWNGYLNYTPPTDFTGEDWFDYQIVSGNILNTSAPATARVHINVGTTASNTKVYAKKKDVLDPNPNWINDQKRTGSAVVQFFSDPDGTKPLDVTGKGITLNVTINSYNLGSSGNTAQNIQVAASGTETVVFTGYFQNGNAMKSVVLNAGTGYIILKAV